jgi:hypothetical protein
MRPKVLEKQIPMFKIPRDLSHDNFTVFCQSRNDHERLCDRSRIMRQHWSILAIALSSGVLFSGSFAQNDGKVQDVTADFSWWPRRQAQAPPPNAAASGAPPAQGQPPPQAQPNVQPPVPAGQPPAGGNPQQPAGQGGAPPSPPPAKGSPPGPGNAGGQAPMGQQNPQQQGQPQQGQPPQGQPKQGQQPPKGGQPPPKANGGNDPNAGYEGWTLQQTGDPSSTHFQTNKTDTDRENAGMNITVPKEPDVYLNATVHVGHISLDVLNITVKVNLDAEVKGLLKFNAGVNAHIDRVRLLIQGVEARVLLEARLENLVKIISDVLDSLDLNPIIATLGNDVGKIVGKTTQALTGSSGGPKKRSIEPRSFRIEHNILYSVNDYSGSTHTNRLLAQNGEIVDEFIDNEGNRHGTAVVGYFDRDMRWNGHNKTMSRNGELVQEYEYLYDPLPGLTVISAIYINHNGKVVATQVVAEAYGGATTSIEKKEFKKRRL